MGGNPSLQAPRIRLTKWPRREFSGHTSPNQPLAMRSHEAARNHLPRITQSSLQRGVGGGMPGRQLRFLSHSRGNSRENSGTGNSLDGGAGGRHSAASRVANSGGGLAGKPHGAETGGL